MAMSIKEAFCSQLTCSCIGMCKVQAFFSWLTVGSRSIEVGNPWGHNSYGFCDVNLMLYVAFDHGKSIPFIL